MTIRRWRHLAALACAWILPGAAPAVAAPDVEVLAVGANHSYQPQLKALKFAETDARRFAEAMQTVGLVPAVHATVLTEPTIREFQAALRQLAEAEAREGPKAAAARKFIFYFSGHSDDRGLHLKDGLISKEELLTSLASLAAHTKIAVLDSCFSGAITAKGVVDAPEFELPRVEFDEPSGSVFLTASSGHQFAYESDDLGGSVFTHHLLQGLYGEADANGDGIVTVDELYQYVYRNTKWQSLNYPTRSAQEPEYVAKLQGQGAIVLSFPAKTNSKLAIDPAIRGELTLAAAHGLQFFKVNKSEGQEKTIQLPTGSYQVVVRDGRSLGEGAVVVAPGRVAVLARRDLSWRAADFGVAGSAKGDSGGSEVVPVSVAYPPGDPLAPAYQVASVTAEAPRSPDAGVFGVAAGTHSGHFVGSSPGPFVEARYDRPFARVGRWTVSFGGAVNFHRTDARGDEPDLMTAANATSGPGTTTSGAPAPTGPGTATGNAPGSAGSATGSATGSASTGAKGGGTASGGAAFPIRGATPATLLPGGLLRGATPAALVVTTETTTVYATAAARYRAPWVTVPALLGVEGGLGQAYESLTDRSDAPYQGRSGVRLLPALFVGLTFEVPLSSGRRFGVTWRRELVSAETSPGTLERRGDAQVLAVGSTL